MNVYLQWSSLSTKGFDSIVIPILYRLVDLLFFS